MTYWLSRPVEVLLQEQGLPVTPPPVKAGEAPSAPLPLDGTRDVLIIGSGYGAAMAALALAEHDQHLPAEQRRRIHVFERGDEYLPDDFPKSLRDMPTMASVLSTPEEDALAETVERNEQALWDIRMGKGVTTIVGSGLGGTSLVNACVAARTPAAALQDWPAPLFGTMEQSGDWAAELDAVFPKIEKLLGVSTLPDAESYPKFQALQRSVKALGGSLAPAPLSISFDKPGVHSANHGPCNRCGNCVVGCHSGAMGSLNMNAWPLARQLGVTLFTGVSVRSLREAAGGGWVLECSLTRVPARRFTVHAATVILGAGSVGSTEILLRSRETHGLSLSGKLGQKFSANGDMLLFSAGQQTPVHALATAPVADVPGGKPSAPGRDAPGPTIIGKASVPLASNRSKGDITLEDGSVPYPIIALWQEMLVTQSFLRRYVDASDHAWQEAHPGHDPLAVSRDLATRSQVLLAMAHEKEHGELTLNAVRDAVLPRLQLPKASYFDALNARLRKGEKKAFDGGHYMPNLAWEPLPKGFSEAVEGVGDVGRHVLTVHPLGGCGMGSHAEEGVVDARGRVFSGSSGTAVHAGLYVLDGAILPGAIGTNPFLSISALSYRLAAALAMAADARAQVAPEGWWRADFPALDKAQWGTIPPGATHALPTAAEEVVEASFSETLVHWFNNEKRSKFSWSETDGPGVNRVLAVLEDMELSPSSMNALRNAPSLILNITFKFAGDTSLERWIENPQLPLQARATLGYDSVGAILETRPEHCMPLLELTGTVILGRRIEPEFFGKAGRIIQAWLRFFRYRRAEAGGLAELLSNLWRAPQFWRVAKVHADWRELVYSLEGQASNGTRLQVHGRKALSYANSQKNVLAALMTLPVTLTNSRNGASVELLLEVDPVGITRGPAPLQVVNSRDGVAALSRIGSFGAYCARMLMQTHFWSFGAYSYEEFKTLDELDAHPTRGRLAAPPAQIRYTADGRTRLSRPVQIITNPQEPGDARIVTQLLRYQPDAPPRGPGPRKSLILVHGLAHSGRVFWTDTIETNYVQYFLSRDYDVWVLDHRTSASIVEDITPGDTWDDIAALDMPWGVSTVFEARNGEHPGPTPHKVYVFGHCIGAGAMAIATLRGLLNFRTQDGAQDSMIAAMALHAVAPWLYASGANRARENIWALFKEMDLIKKVEPRPHKKATAEEVIYDRLASSSLNETELAQWPSKQMKDDDRGPGFQKALYTRYTIFWGRQWVKANVTEATRKEFCGMIGAVPVAVLQQVYYSITRGLLSAHDGHNAYVRHEDITQHWTFPTFFLHGNENTVFDMETAKTSAEQLLRHRRHVRAGDTSWQTDGKQEPQVYTDHGVWVEIMQGYGHMDMIFGKNVAVDVCPRLHLFFDAAREDRLREAYVDWANDSVKRSLFDRYCTANSHSRPTSRPLAGLILSHPRRLSDGRGTVRLWCEAQDFTANAASGLRMNLLDVDELPLGEALRKLRHTLRDNDTEADTQAWQREFWLYDYEFAPLPGMRRRFALEYDPKEIDLVKAIGNAKSGLKGGTETRVPMMRRIVSLLEWADMPWFRRQMLDQRTPGDDVVLSFLAGSCLHPGSTFEELQSGTIFHGMCRHVAPEHDWQVGAAAVGAGAVVAGLPANKPLRGVDHVLLLGDQIYADASAGLFDARVPYEKYRTPYRKAFGSPAARRLFSHVPTYFAIDDHEVDDNWDGSEKENGKEVNPWFARRMAWMYQVHQREWNHNDIRLWQHFNSAGAPFFLFDTRMERQKNLPRSNANALLNRAQRDAFTVWLQSAEVQGSEAVFFSTGSSLAPIAWPVLQEPVLAAQEDGVLAYPGFLAWLVDTLHAHAGTKRVFWYTGDPHFSCTASLQLQHVSAVLEITQICCSALYAPYSFANANPHNHRWDVPFHIDVPLAGSAPVKVRGTQSLLCDAKQHFVRSDLVRRDGRLVLSVQAFDNTGAPLCAPRLL